MSAAFNNLLSSSRGKPSTTEDVSAESPDKTLTAENKVKKQVNRKLDTSIEMMGDDLSDSDDGNKNLGKKNDPPSFYVTASKKRGSVKTKCEPDNSFESRTEMMKDFTSSFSTFVLKKTSVKETPKSDNIDLWVEILGDRVREMDPKIRGRFMMV